MDDHPVGTLDTPDLRPLFPHDVHDYIIEGIAKAVDCIYVLSEGCYLQEVDTKKSTDDHCVSPQSGSRKSRYVFKL